MSGMCVCVCIVVSDQTLNEETEALVLATCGDTGFSTAAPQFEGNFILLVWSDLMIHLQEVSSRCVGSVESGHDGIFQSCGMRLAG